MLKDVLLKELEKKENDLVFEMFYNIPNSENGFGNKLSSKSREEFDIITDELVEESKNKSIENGRVPQTYYILFIDDKPVGFSKLRHILSKELIEHGGNIGFCIYSKYRNNGYAKILLNETLKRAKILGLKKVLITCNNDNAASYKTIEACNGILENTIDETRRYWVYL